MAVQDSPKYEEWSCALDKLKEANDRYREARRTNSPGIAAAAEDLRIAQEEYDRISAEID